MSASEMCGQMKRLPLRETMTATLKNLTHSRARKSAVLGAKSRGCPERSWLIVALGLGKKLTSFDGSNNVHFTFCIPRGYDGSQGFPSEVTNSQLNSAISSKSNNTNP